MHLRSLLNFMDENASISEAYDYFHLKRFSRHSHILEREMLHQQDTNGNQVIIGHGFIKLKSLSKIRHPFVVYNKTGQIHSAHSENIVFYLILLPLIVSVSMLWWQ